MIRTISMVCMIVAGTAACGDGSSTSQSPLSSGPPVAAAAAPRTGLMGSSPAAQSAEAAMAYQLRGYHGRLMAVFERARQACVAGSQASCAHGLALGEGANQVVVAINALEQGRSIAVVRDAAGQVFDSNAKVLERAGISVEAQGSCWLDGGNACLRIYERLSFDGMTAVGRTWGVHIVERVLDRDTYGLALPD